MGWGTSFGSDPLHALTLCLSYCYVTPGVTPFAQTHPIWVQRECRCRGRGGRAWSRRSVTRVTHARRCTCAAVAVNQVQHALDLPVPQTLGPQDLFGLNRDEKIHQLSGSQRALACMRLRPFP